ncbi:YigZ family protein [Arachidicoccus ginsenosidimutans]|uniref:IMPACT family protein n=1 Tax=Arachidicoccus sp. BS20 TaxID=1850526 RepID=UPI0007F0F325|nr:YigZ family protein [Arachidicoccus sp. BS20]ANI88550.1 YigZ family protein [Arachidicoccus sp. BS20]
MTTQNNFYKTIQQEAVAEFKDRGSKFLAYAFPMNDVQVFKNRLAELKKEHPKAVHFCFAYRLGNDGNNFRSGDDGEPSGSAGKPILGQLDSKELINTAIVVVRYFGGTLLGVPGLINAYKTASALALQLTPIIKKPVIKRFTLEFDYTRMNDVMRWLKNFNAQIIEQEQQLFCKIIADIPLDNMEEAKHIFKDMQGVEFSI